MSCDSGSSSFWCVSRWWVYKSVASTGSPSYVPRPEEANWRLAKHSREVTVYLWGMSHLPVILTRSQRWGHMTAKNMLFAEFISVHGWDLCKDPKSSWEGKILGKVCSVYGRHLRNFVYVGGRRMGSLRWLALLLGLFKTQVKVAPLTSVLILDIVLPGPAEGAQAS